jgi:hypothetical protein
MSMYDLVAGDGAQHSRGSVLLAVLGNPDPGRFRDAWVERDEQGEPIIAIYTRNGGGNRECYCDDGNEPGSCTGCRGEAFAAHPLHLRNADDDCTYATYYFSVPPEHRDELAAFAQDHVDTSARWTDLINAISGGAR